jgi:hypothetical protein
MKNSIKIILKEETENIKDKFNRKVISYLARSGYDGSSKYQDILKVLNSNFGVEGMDAFELYQLFKDNWKTVDMGGELNKTDISKLKVRSANNRGRELVKNKIPFKGSNTHAEYVGKVYVVYSYNWYPIFVFKDGQWFENENRYSVSTAKQMSQLRPYNQGEIIKASKNKLSDIIYG